MSAQIGWDGTLESVTANDWYGIIGEDELIPTLYSVKEDRSDPEFVALLKQVATPFNGAAIEYKSGSTPPAAQPEPAINSAAESTSPATRISSSGAPSTTPEPVPTSVSGQRVNISAGVAMGMLLQKTEPIYPPIAKAARVSGTVVVRAVVSQTGEIKDVSVVSGPTMLQQAALDAVKAWRYRPYLLNNQPTEVETTVNVNFALGRS